jgi:O-antigen ligase
MDLIAWIYLSAAIVPLLLYLSVEKPFIFPFVYIFLLPLESLLSIRGEETVLFNLMKPLGVFIFFGWLLSILSRKGKLVEAQEIILPAIFIIIGISSTLWAYSRPEVAIRVGIRILLNVGLFFMFYQWLSSPQKIWNSFKAYALGTLVSSVITVLLFIKNPNERVAIYGQNQGIYPVTLIVGLFFFIYMLLNTKRIHGKLFYALLFAIVYFSALASGTRSFMYSSLIIFPLFIYKIITIKGLKSQYPVQSILQLMLIIFILAGLTTVFLKLIQNFELIQTRFIMGFKGQAVAARLFAIKNTYLALEYNPLLGVGLGNYAYFNASISNAFIEAHNVFITVLQELGMIGFIVFIAFYLRISMKTLKLYNSMDSANIYMLLPVFSFFMVSVASLTEPLLQQKCLWFVFAQVVSQSIIQKNQKEG